MYQILVDFLINLKKIISYIIQKFDSNLKFNSNKNNLNLYVVLIFDVTKHMRSMCKFFSQ